MWEEFLDNSGTRVKEAEDRLKTGHCGVSRLKAALVIAMAFEFMEFSF